jgi:hypothetical protein
LLANARTGCSGKLLNDVQDANNAMHATNNLFIVASIRIKHKKTATEVAVFIITQSLILSF